eukprot:4970495-Amphidinium_carterae.1
MAAVSHEFLCVCKAQSSQASWLDTPACMGHQLPAMARLQLSKTCAACGGILAKDSMNLVKQLSSYSAWCLGGREQCVRAERGSEGGFHSHGEF